MKLKLTWALLWVALFAVIPLRVYQYLWQIDQGTGFYKDPVQGYIFFGAVVLFLILLLICSCSFHYREETVKPKRNIFMGILSIGMGLIFIASGVKDVYDAFFVMEKPVFDIVVAFLAILSAAAFFTLAARCYFSPRMESGLGFAFVMVLPTIWYLFRLCNEFLKYTLVTAVSDHQLTIASMCALLLFTFFHCSLFSGVYVGRSKRYAIAFGAAAVLLTGASILPRYYLLATGEYAAFQLFEMPNVVDTAMLLYSLVFVTNLCFGEKERKPESGLPMPEEKPLPLDVDVLIDADSIPDESEGEDDETIDFGYLDLDRKNGEEENGL